MSLKICLIFFESSMDDKKLEEISEYISQLLLQDISLGKRLQISNKIINLSHDTCLQNNMKELLRNTILILLFASSVFILKAQNGAELDD